MRQGLAHSIAISSQQTLREQGYDRYVIWSVLVLMGIGVVAVYSAVTFMAMDKAGGDTGLFLKRHLLHIILALIVLAAFSAIDYHKVMKASIFALGASIALLAGVQIYGIIIGGAKRWIEIFGFQFQPSELARVFLLIHVAHLLAKKQEYIKKWSRSFVPIMFWTLPTVLLIGISDLSTAAMLFATIFLMCAVGRVSVKHLSGIAAIVLIAATILIMSSPERAVRIEAWLGVKVFPHTTVDDVFNAQGEMYQTRQAQIAIAQGKLLGVGPGKSVQRDFLPAPYNDFIFAIIAEEYGVVGAFGLLALFMVLLFRGTMRIARDAPDDEGMFLGMGITVIISLYAFVHACVSCGVLPVTGLPMPFVSYGGTSLLASGMLIGMLLNISRHRQPRAATAKSSRRRTR